MSKAFIDVRVVETAPRPPSDQLLCVAAVDGAILYGLRSSVANEIRCSVSAFDMKLWT